MRRPLAALVLLVAAVPGAADAAQELTPQAVEQIQALLEEKAARTPAQRRIDSQLLAAARMVRGEPVARGIARLDSAWARLRRRPGDRVLVDVRADVDAALLERLRRLGALVESAFPALRAVRAEVPLARVEELAALPGVYFVEPAAEATTNTGSATSQGDAAHRAPAVRALGLTGEGIKVGVLSDGVDSLAARQASGDLPPTCPLGTPCVKVLSGQAGNGDEGTAMLEIVHDLAPSAELYFATAFGGQAAMAANIRALAETGCTVIVDDVTYYAEGAFQDGPIARAVNDVTATGVLYFSSAANSGNKNDGTSGTWEGDFVASGTTIPVLAGAGAIHGFGGGQNSNPLTLGSRVISLKWSDPLGASGNDYDLFLLDATLTSIVAASTNSQTGAQDPYEAVASLSPSPAFPAGSRVVAVRYAGATRALRLDTNRGRLSTSTAGSTYGHNAGESTIGVAATDGRAPGPGTPFTGGAANPVELYSSDGPRRIFYEPAGTAITPGNLLFGTSGGRLLQKPDITAADCVTTTTPGFTTFCGTSAAAPHAAAIAALLLSDSPSPPPALVRAAMGATALDIEAAGVDRDSGRGIVMADRSRAAVDLQVAMTGPASVAAGADAEYFLEITHNGGADAATVVVSNPTPAGLVFVSNSGDCATVFPCALGTLAAGQTREITTTFHVPGSYSGASPFTNTATVGSAATDPLSANDSASVSTSVTGPATADLSVSKTGPGSVVRGTNAVYTITVSNAGPQAAASVQVADPTPAGLTFVSNSGGCTTAFPCALGTVASGATRTITATFAVPSGYSGPNPFTNTATVSSATADPVPGNGSSSTATTVTTGADLAVTKTGPAFATRGGSLTYTIVVTNAGPAAASAVQVDDPTPTGLAFVSNAGHCATAFPCALGSLPSGASRTITSTFSVPAGHDVSLPITNTATVGSAITDPNPANDMDTATSLFGAFYTVTPCRLVDTRMPPDGPPLQPGEERTFALAELCGVPTGAVALSLNVTVASPSAPGNLRLYPADVPVPQVSNVNFSAGQTRANNAIVTAASDGSVAITVKNSSVGTVQLVLDVNGYFE